MKIGSVQNFRTNQSEYHKNQTKPAFKGHIGIDNALVKGIDVLVLETAFFRDFKTKLYVLDYIKNNFANNKIVKIVVGACSTGEEAVTSSIMFDELKDKVVILGIDLSKKAIKKAQSGKYTFQIPNIEGSLLDSYAAFQDTFLAVKGDSPLTVNQLKQKKLFDEFLEPTVNPKQKIGIIQRIKNNFILALDCISPLVKNIVEYRLKPQKALNCNFVAGDMRELNKITKGEKSDVIFFSNALYHLITHESWENDRIMRSNSENIVEKLAEEFMTNLNPNGLVCFGEEEAVQIPKIDIVQRAMQKLGFEPLNETDKHCPNVYRKIA